MIEVALDHLKDRLKPEDVQVFYLTVVKGLGFREVAIMLGLSAARVLLIRHRVAKLVKKEIRLLGGKGERLSGSASA